MTQTLVCAQFRRNKRESVKVSLSEFRGTPTIDVRCWFATGDGDKAGRAGITLSAKHLPELADGINRALDEATARGLIKSNAA
jgi:hypothetical protein